MAEEGYPGGFSSNYPATDYDARLTGIAREAVPIIVAVDGFYARHGQCPRPIIPGEFAELRAALAEGLVAARHGQFVRIGSPGTVTGWLYYVSEDPRSCSLSRKLGWDPDLVWSRDRDQTQWIFVPGDGGDEKPIRIEPLPGIR
jgi:hypothetical protein